MALSEKMKRIIQLENTTVKNFNWYGTGWLFYKRGQGYNFAINENKSI